MKRLFLSIVTLCVGLATAFGQSSIDRLNAEIKRAEKEIAKQVKQAKKDGIIDQFIYGSISATYLADIVDSL